MKCLTMMLAVAMLTGCSGFVSKQRAIGGSSSEGSVDDLTLASSADSISLNTTVPPPFQSSSIFSMQTLLAGLLNVYAPEQLNDKLFMGGWLGEADHSRRDDRLYVSQLVNGSWQAPTPVQWTNADHVEGYVPGYHANDPSIVHRSDVNWEYMYYTGLPNQFTANLAQIVSYNQVGFAASSDGGRTWTDGGIVIGQNNGIDLSGAWAPSAILNNGEVWVYYHTGAGCNFIDCHLNGDGEPTTPLAPRVLRSRLDINGWRMIGTNEIKNVHGGSLNLTNVNIQHAFGRFWLAANTPDLLKIVLYVSDDGLNFTPFDGGDGVLINGGDNMVLTPGLQVLSERSVAIQFGFAPKGQMSGSIQQWTFSLN